MPHDSVLLFFAQYIQSELGIIYAEHNYFQLQNRLEEIAKLLGISSLEKLHEEGKKGISGAFRQLLLDVATNNETSFFRDPRIFKGIEQTVLPAFLEVHPKNVNLSIWSAASSSGQEALSTAILLKEWAKKEQRILSYHITGTDISERVLQRAKNAQYSQLEVQRGLPTPLLLKYFTKDEQDRWTAKPELTQNIVFKKQNLKERFAFNEKFYLILCRNVLIYQNVDGKKEILNRMTDLLEDGGFLILGSGESLLGLSNEFDQIAIDGAILYRKKLKLQKTG